MAIYNAQDITAEFIMNYFLYGQADKPASIVDNALVRPADQKSIIFVDAASYMSGGPGRFVNASMSTLVQNFFSSSDARLAGDGTRHEYVVSAIKSIVSGDDHIAMQQYNYDDQSGDYGTRTFVWGSSAFTLSPDVKFVVDAFGNRTIENLSIRPFDDNFDFESNDFFTRQFENTLKSWMDPYELSSLGLGRTVDIDFVNVGALPVISNYSQTSYQSDQQAASQYYYPVLQDLPAIYNAASLIADDLFADGTTKFLDAQNRPIVYGTNETDILNQRPALDDTYLAQYVPNGIVYVAGAGDDILTDTVGADVMLGGIGVDTADFSGGGALNITIGSAVYNGTPTPASMVSLQIAGRSGPDLLSSVEKITLSSGTDTVTISANADLSSIQSINAGAQAPNGKDTLDLSQMHTGYSIVNSELIGDSGSVDVKIINFEKIVGLATDNNISITTGTVQEIVTADGNDTVSVSGSGVTIKLGGGNDTLKASGPGTIVTTGTGSDKIEASHNGQLLITDASSDDRITYYDHVLTGGVRWGGSESIYAIGVNGERYGRNTSGDLIILDARGNETFIPKFNFGTSGTNLTAGIYVIEVTYKIERSNQWTAAFETAASEVLALEKIGQALYGWKPTGRKDPLVLDLDGNGIEFTIQEASHAMFDIDKDGFSESVGWIGGNDGFLVRDLNSNGKIDDVGEMFGSDAMSGFAQLALLDGNHDGKVNALDDGLADFNGDGVVDSTDTFDKLRLWVDGNENGVTDAGELKSLEDYNIVSISVGATASNFSDGADTISETGTYERDDGTTGLAADVQLETDNSNTKWLGDSTVSSAAASRPNLKGFGTLTDLNVAMTLAPGLISVMDAALPTFNTLSMANLRDAIRPVLYAWEQAVPIPAGTPGTEATEDFHFVGTTNQKGAIVYDFLIMKSDDEGTYYAYASGQPVYNASHIAIERPTLQQVLDSNPAQGTWNILTAADIAFLERFTGERIGLGIAVNPSSDTISRVADALTASWNEMNRLAVRLAAQGPLSPFFAGITYDAASDLFRPTTVQQFAPMLEVIFGATPTDPVAAAAYMAQWKDIIGVMLPDFRRDDSARQITDAYLFSNIVDAFENVPVSLSIQSVAASLFDIPASELIVGGSSLVGGDTANDILYLSNPNQVATGQGGEDAYVVGYNFGDATIHDIWQGLGANQEDSIWFAHLSVADLTFTRDGIDLVISQNNTSNQIRVVDEFAGRRPGLVTAFQDFDESVEIVKFADGTTWDKFDIAKAVGLNARPVNGNLIGTGDQDFLYAGYGTTYMSGGNLGDQYFYGLGNGQVTIDDSESWIWGDNRDFVNFGQGIDESGVTFSRNGNSNSLQIAVNGTNDVLTIENQFEVDYGLINTMVDRIETFTFADGSYIGWEDIIKQFDANAGTIGNDTIYGFSYADTLTGGKGDDFLDGGLDGDTYIYTRGDGNDTISEGTDVVSDRGGLDSIKLHNIAPGDVSIVRNGNDAMLVFAESAVGAGDAGSILLKEELDNWFARGVESIVFDDGTVWTQNDLRLRVLAQSETSGNDNIVAFNTNDVIQGGLGDDTLSGGAGDDTYIYQRGDGNDVIIEVAAGNFSTIDTLRLHGVDPDDIALVRDGTDVTLQIAESSAGAGDAGSILIKEDLNDWFAQGIESIVFDNGVVWTQSDLRTALLAQASTTGDDVIVGFNTNDTIRGGLGNDTINGGPGDDTYLYARGDGNDTIIEGAAGNFSTFDTLRFDDINPGDVTVVRNGNDVTLVIGESSPGAGDGGSVVLKDEVNDFFSTGVEQVVFADGTVWTQASIRTTLISTAGTDGDDVINGSSSDDILAGGKGNDTINGGPGDDIYIYARGDGNDTIIEGTSGNFTTFDTLILRGIHPSDVSLVRNDLDVTLVFAESAPGAGDGGSILLKEELDDWYSRGVERITFDDGTVWTPADLRGRLLADATSSGANSIIGFNVADTIVAGTGDRYLNGRGGGDTYIYTSAGGNDVIDDGGPSTLVMQDIASTGVTLSRPNGDDKLVLTVTSTGKTITLTNEFGIWNGGGLTINFSDGITWNKGQLQQLVLDAQSAANTGPIYGFGGRNDTIVAGLGDRYMNGEGGSDTYIYTSAGGNDVIDDGGPSTLVMQDIASTGVTLSRPNGGGSLVLTVTSTGKTITLNDEFGQFNNGGLTVNLSDGVTWTKGQLQQLILDAQSAANSGPIYGFGGRNDTIVAGLGDRYMNGEGGSDTYIYTSAGGNDVIEDGGPSTLVMQDIASTGVTLSRPNGGGSLVLTVTSTGRTITLNDEFGQFNNGGLTINFSDGVTWNKGQLQQLILDAQSAANSGPIYGFGGRNDTIVAGLGDRYMNGEGGSDTYIYTSAGGNDVIEDGGPSTLVMQDIASTGVVLSRPNGGDALVITVTATGKTVTLNNEFGQWNNGGLSVNFSDGVSLTRSDIHDLLTGGADGDYLYHRGDGQVTLDDTVHSVEMGTGISASDLILQSNGTDLIVRLRDTNDAIIVHNDLINRAWGVSSVLNQIKLSDGTSIALGQPTAGQGAPLTFTWVGSAYNSLSGSNYGSNVFEVTAHDITVNFANNVAIGGSNDVKYTRGSGRSDIYLNGATGRISFGTGISSQDVYLQANGQGDLAVQVRNDPGDYILVHGDLSTLGTGLVSSGVNELLFSDGSTLSIAQTSMVDALSFTWLSGDYGTFNGSVFGNNFFEVASHDVTVNFANNGAVGGRNEIKYTRGAGRADVYLNGGTGSIDFGANVSAQAVYLQANGQGDLIVLIRNDGSDYIVVHNDLSTSSGGTVASGLGALKFFDGSTLNLGQQSGGLPLTFTWLGTNQYATLNGTNFGSNAFEVSTNNVTVNFSNNASVGGTNTVKYAHGSGSSEVYLNGAIGKIELGTGIAAQDTYLQADNNGNLWVRVRGSSDSILVHNDLVVEADGTVASGIGQLSFSDGSILNIGEDTLGGNLPVFTWSASSNNYNLTGSKYGSNDFELASGNGSVNFGSAENGGLNNVKFGVGSGYSDIYANGGTGKISFNSSVSAQDVYLQANGDGDLFINIRGDGSDGIRVHGDLAHQTWGVSSAVEELDFSDGTVLHVGQPSEGLGLPLSFTWIASNNNYNLTGSKFGSNAFELMAGNGSVNLGSAEYGGTNTIKFGIGSGYSDVYLNGGTGKIAFNSSVSAQDVYLQANGDGDLFVNIRGDSSDGIRVHGDLTRQIWGVSSGIPELDFSDGSVMHLGQPATGEGLPLSFTWIASNNNYNLTGSKFGSNAFELTAGNGSVNFGSAEYGGTNTIKFGIGSGYSDVYLNDGTGKIAFNSSVSAQDVYLQANGDGDLFVNIRGDNSDGIRVHGDLTQQTWGVSSGIQELDFSDGSVMHLGQPATGLGLPLSFTWIGTGNNVSMTGSNYGANIFEFGPGSEAATGGGVDKGGPGYNTYKVSNSTGQATIYANEAPNTHNELDFIGGITDDQLWFMQSGNDLKIDLVGTNTQVSIKDWFSASINELQEINAGGLKIDSQVSQLVQAMATYSTNNTGFDPTSSSIHTLPVDTSLQNAVAVAWHT